jgi:hypothetical protein
MKHEKASHLSQFFGGGTSSFSAHDAAHAHHSCLKSWRHVSIICSPSNSHSKAFLFSFSHYLRLRCLRTSHTLASTTNSQRTLTRFNFLHHLSPRFLPFSPRFLSSGSLLSSLFTTAAVKHSSLLQPLLFTPLMPSYRRICSTSVLFRLFVPPRHTKQYPTHVPHLSFNLLTLLTSSPATTLPTLFTLLLIG